MRSAVAHRRHAFERNLLDDCDRMDETLMPVVRHSMWDDVGTLARIPFSSTVLQRRRGYRDVLRHFARIRLAPRIPLDRREMRDLLALKNIALLYELWSFFRLADIIQDLIGPPSHRARPTSSSFETALEGNRAFEWICGVKLAYNASFSRSRAPPRHTYSLRLHPDIALEIERGPNRGLHLLDAKFRRQKLADSGLAGGEGDATAVGEATDESAAERRGDFKRGDLYKMHTYRDAIPAARSVWILYPGDEFRFFAASGAAAPGETPEDLPGSVDGVGAIPFPAKPPTGSIPNPHAAARATLQRLLDRR